MDRGVNPQDNKTLSIGRDASSVWVERTRLAAIVESSQDAILTKDLDGTITTWNRGAEHIFGYTAAEAIGQNVTMLIPPDRHDEEPAILGRIRRGERVEHYETIRRHKTGRLIHISLSVSPLRDEEGRIVGASKIARDIDERFRAQEQQRLLLGEMHHRIKNVFALTSGLVRLSAARAQTPAEMARMVAGRLDALAKAHTLTVPPVAAEGIAATGRTTLRSLLRVLLAPAIGDEEFRAVFSGDDISLSPHAVTPLALVLHELVTNATKHGALSDGTGTVQVACRREGGQVVLSWRENAARPSARPSETSGFGTRLSQMTVEHQLGGTMTREWGCNGLSVTISFGESQLA